MKEKEKIAKLLKNVRTVLLFYLKTGLFTFGGGWSIVAQMKREFVEKKELITDEELTDLTSVGRSLPGTMIGNVSFMFGYHVGGPVCGFAALIGIAFWPFAILSVVAVLYDMVMSNPFVAGAMTGVRAAVVPIMISATAALWKQSIRDRFCAALMIAAFLAGMLGVGNVPLILCGAVAGILKRSGGNRIRGK